MVRAGAPEHIKEATPILKVIAFGTFLFGGLLALIGIVLVIMHAAGETYISAFGLKFKSNHVGITAIFLGVATVIIVITKLMKRLRELGELPADRTWWNSELF